MTLKVLKIIGNILYVFVIFSVVSIALITVFTYVGVDWKYKAFVVKSGSMKPTIQTGSMVIVRSQSDYQKGDIITFYSKANKKDVKSTVTHRIVEVNNANNKTQYATKGDANDGADAFPIEKGAVLGKLLFAIPYIGYVIAFAKTQMGFLLLIILPSFIIIFSEAQNIKKAFLDWKNKRKVTESLPPIAVFMFALILLSSKSYARTVPTGLRDSEASEYDTYSTTDLEMIMSAENFGPGYDNMFKGETVLKNGSIKNIGALDFLYKLYYEYSSDHEALCNELDAKITFDSTELYSGKLKDLEVNFSGTDLTALSSGDESDFTFEISVSDDAPYDVSQKTCTFNLVTVAWQADFLDETNGFWDEEKISNTITTGDWVPSAPTGMRILDHEGNDLGCNGVTNDRTITVDWADNTEFDLKNYDYMIREGTIIAHPTVSYYTGTIRDLDGLYRYRVRAVDDGANTSDWTEWCEVTLDRTIDDAEPGDVIINEVMWMGSSVSESDEWIELYNSTDHTIKLKNWVIQNAGDGSDLTIPDGETISSHSYYLISKYDSDDSSSALADSVNVDYVYSELGLNDGGENLILVDAFGNIIDETGSGSWDAGENGAEKHSMERNNDPDSGWHSCTDSVCNDTAYWDAEGTNYGTPKAENHSESDESSEPAVEPQMSVEVPEEKIEETPETTESEPVVEDFEIESSEEPEPEPESKEPPVDEETNIESEEPVVEEVLVCEEPNESL